MDYKDILVCLDKRILEFLKENEEISDETRYLTEWILRKDLKEALNYNKGYYKNEKGKYIYVKGIEVTNDVSNLCRMGYNGEDRGVWVHYCEVENNSAMYVDVPIGSFQGMMFSKSLPKDELMHPITKEEFDAQVKKALENITADYEQKRDVQEYIDFFEKWDKLYEEVKKDYENIDANDIPASEEINKILNQ